MGALETDGAGPVVVEAGDPFGLDETGAVALLATGSVAGGLLGARLGRALPPAALRAAIVVIGIYGIVQLAR